MVLGGLIFLFPLPVFALQEITLLWDPSPAANVVGYNLYYGAASYDYTNRVSVGNVTEATLTGLGEGVTYFFAVTAFSSSGDESEPSNELSCSIPVPLGDLSENFDGVAVPSLPPGWITTASGAQSPWLTQAFTSDSAPNVAFSPDSANIGLSSLVSPSFALPAGQAQLTCRNNYNLETGAGTDAFDGGVLEIKIGANDFVDILAAGGSFVTGGYNSVIDTHYGNPLAGRQAWSGNSGGFITTTVNLPAAAAGQNIQLRWSCGTDDGGGGSGWCIDSVSISSSGGATNTPPVIVSQPVSQTNNAGTTATFNVAAGGTGLSYQWIKNGTLGLSNSGNVSGATSSSLTLAGLSTSDAAAYSVIVRNSGGSVTSQLATLTILAASDSFSQNFDGVAAPNLPAGWTTAAGGGQSPWVISTSARDTVPNAAFSPDSAGIGLNELVSPPITLSAGQSQLTFRNNYNLETGAGTDGFDGGVLEIKIAANSFVDILAAGGSFISGGYNSVIDTGYSNPLAGRQAWSGNSGGFITTKVNLPLAAVGQTIQLRWRCGTDDGGGGGGWRIDTISLSSGGGFTNTPPVITSQPTGRTNDAGATATFTVVAGGSGLGYQWIKNGTINLSNGGNVSGATSFSLALASVSSIDAAAYSVVVTNSAGSVTSQTATLTVTTLPGITSQPASCTNFSESFDGVTAPNLPSGWTTTASGAQSPWVTQAFTNDTTPNVAFSPGVAKIGLSSLVSPSLILPIGQAQLTFRNNYNLETGAGTNGFDGGVLEIKISTNSFVDILAAGGAFVSGGYNCVIDTHYSNPLAGRQAWSGNSGGFITTTVNLPLAAGGQSIQLRWSCGTDDSNGSTGWCIDSIGICSGSGITNTPMITISPPMSPPAKQTSNAGAGTAFNAGDRAPAPYQRMFNSASLVNGNPQTVNACTYAVAVPNSVAGASNNFPSGESAPPPHIGSMAVTNGVLVITWSAVQGKRYRLQFSEDLVGGNWADVMPDVLAAGPTASATNVLGRSPSGFYRIRLLP